MQQETLLLHVDSDHIFLFSTKLKTVLFDYQITEDDKSFKADAIKESIKRLLNKCKKTIKTHHKNQIILTFGTRFFQYTIENFYNLTEAQDFYESLNYCKNIDTQVASVRERPEKQKMYVPVKRDVHYFKNHKFKIGFSMIQAAALEQMAKIFDNLGLGIKEITSKWELIGRQLPTPTTNNDVLVVDFNINKVSCAVYKGHCLSKVFHLEELSLTKIIKKLAELFSLSSEQVYRLIKFYAFLPEIERAKAADTRSKLDRDISSAFSKESIEKVERLIQLFVARCFKEIKKHLKGSIKNVFILEEHFFQKNRTRVHELIPTEYDLFFINYCQDIKEIYSPKVKKDEVKSLTSAKDSGTIRGIVDGSTKSLPLSVDIGTASVAFCKMLSTEERKLMQGHFHQTDEKGSLKANCANAIKYDNGVLGNQSINELRESTLPHKVHNPHNPHKEHRGREECEKHRGQNVQNGQNERKGQKSFMKNHIVEPVESFSKKNENHFREYNVILHHFFESFAMICKKLFLLQ